jgi:hypothetical protein
VNCKFTKSASINGYKNRNFQRWIWEVRANTTIALAELISTNLRSAGVLLNGTSPDVYMRRMIPKKLTYEVNILGTPQLTQFKELLETLILINELSRIARGIIVVDFEGFVFILTAENAMVADDLQNGLGPIMAPPTP